MAGFDHKTIDAKWQKFWDDNQTFLTPKTYVSNGRTKPKYYVLDMFPYPSGDGLHVGHPKGYTATDVVARAKRMMGFNVLRVMGWDSFGLPAERRAERTGEHPSVITERNINTFKGQLKKLGLSYDWTRELATSDPKYYKWTQWIFEVIHERGLAYRAEVPVNFCPALGTVLANEEVHDGKYVETGDPVEKRLMRQWMLEITKYADRLSEDLEGLDWPAGTYKAQKDWIGKSIGANVVFEIAGGPTGVPPITVFTTRPDTLFGGTWVVLAPEHALVDQITTPAQKDAVAKYREEVGKRSERDRTTEAADAPKTGVFTGAFAVNPVNGKHIPIWIADYVLASYGTGAVFACPAHDERDHAFATKFGLPIIEVVKGGADVQVAAYTGDGPHVNSEFLDGLRIEEAKEKVIAWLTERKLGEGTIRYRLRDWLFSRQRYWGEPFPLYELADGTVKAVPLDELPVVLPKIDEYKPTRDGQPPLARAQDWLKTVDKATGQPATRETNTVTQWAGSCWYYLRFLSPDRDDVAWDKEEEKYWMPVDLYVGGNEHAVLHLLYARFWHKVLFDAGLVTTKEPFQRLFHQGMIHKTSFRDPASGKYYSDDEVEQRQLGADGRDKAWFVKGTDTVVDTKLDKMSKSRYNVVNPDDMCRDFGADAMRMYELFMGPLEDGVEWETAGVAGTRRFLDRAWRLLAGDPENNTAGKVSAEAPTDDKDLERALHAAIKKVTASITDLRFNTAISEMMVFVNEATSRKAVPKAWFESFVKILSPFAPHVCEEMWGQLGHTESIAYAPWPVHDEAKLKTDTITLAVQVNGKVRGQIVVGAGEADAAILAAAKAEVASHLAGKTIKMEKYVKGRLVTLAVAD